MQTARPLKRLEGSPITASVNTVIEELRAELHLLVPLVDPFGLARSVRVEYQRRIAAATESDHLSLIASELLELTDSIAFDSLENGEPVRFERACLAGKELRILLIALAFTG
jgi:hypothetical protein